MDEKRIVNTLLKHSDDLYRISERFNNIEKDLDAAGRNIVDLAKAELDTRKNLKKVALSGFITSIGVIFIHYTLDKRIKALESNIKEEEKTADIISFNEEEK